MGDLTLSQGSPMVTWLVLLEHKLIYGLGFPWVATNLVVGLILACKKINLHFMVFHYVLYICAFQSFQVIQATFPCFCSVLVDFFLSHQLSPLTSCRLLLSHQLSPLTSSPLPPTIWGPSPTHNNGVDPRLWVKDSLSVCITY